MKTRYDLISDSKTQTKCWIEYDNHFFLKDEKICECGKMVLCRWCEHVVWSNDDKINCKRCRASWSHKKCHKKFCENVRGRK